MLGVSVSVSDLTKMWGRTTALGGVTFTAKAEEFTVLLGPSGCGKSTLLRLIAGLEEATAGHILIAGRDVTDQRPGQRDVAMVFQSYALFPHLNVADNITFGLQIRGASKQQRRSQLADVAQLLELEELLERKPSQLSGGQQQRVALGRALIAKRPICLMDEPLSNLDARLRHDMRNELRSLQKRLGFTMIYVTHDQIEAITMADQVVLLNNGKIEQASSPRLLYEQPETAFAAGFIGTPPMNLFSPRALGEAVGQVSLDTLGSNILLGVRPECVRLDQGNPAMTFKAIVKALEYQGIDTLVSCRGGDSTITARTTASGELAIEQEVMIGFERADLHIFDTTTGQRK